MRKVNILPNLFTIGNLYCGLWAIIAIINDDGDFIKAAWLIMLALLFDIFDGKVARITRSSTPFGKELDSLADLVSFGVAPAMIVYVLFLRTFAVPKIGVLITIIYAISAALRLARFNVRTITGEKFFVGLPTPAAAATIAAYVMAVPQYEFRYSSHIVVILMLAVSLLMVSSFRYPKDQVLEVARSQVFGILFVIILAVALFDFLKNLALLILAAALAYDSLGPLRLLYWRAVPSAGPVFEEESEEDEFETSEDF